MGTSNSLFQLSLNGAGPTESRASSTSDNTGSDDTDNDHKGVSTTALVIGGGAAVGIGVFIAAISGGSGSDLSTDTPQTPGTPGGNNNGGNNGGNTTGGNGGTGGTGDVGGTGGTVGGGDPPTTTPEPASMALLASGLAGMGGFQLRRHRRRIQDEK